MNKRNGNWAGYMFCLLVLFFLSSTAHAAIRPIPSCQDGGVACLPEPSPQATPLPGLVSPGAPSGVQQASLGPWTPGTGYVQVGTSVPDIQARSLGNMVALVNGNPGFATELANYIPDNVLALMSNALYLQSNDNATPFLVAATKSGLLLNDPAIECQNAVRLANAFGRQYEDPVVVEVLPPGEVQACYFQKVGTYGTIEGSQAAAQERGLVSATPTGVVSAHILAGYTPNIQWNMGLTDVYMEFLAAGEGTTYGEALLDMFLWATGPYGKIAGYSYALGTGIYYAGEYIDPGLWEDMIEGLIGLPGLPDGTITIGDPVMLPSCGPIFGEDSLCFL